jgi:hypothetical protein
LKSPEASQFSSTAPTILQSGNSNVPGKNIHATNNTFKKKLSRKDRKKALAFTLLGGITESHREEYDESIVSPVSVSSTHHHPFSPAAASRYVKSFHDTSSSSHGLVSLAEAQMSDSSESSSDSDDDSSDEESSNNANDAGPRFANVSGSEAWYLKRKC